jgi:hypothetical protein
MDPAGGSIAAHFVGAHPDVLTAGHSTTESSPEARVMSGCALPATRTSQMSSGGSPTNQRPASPPLPAVSSEGGQAPEMRSHLPERF